jgi:Bacterial Ig-like domain (group 2)
MLLSSWGDVPLEVRVPTPLLDAVWAPSCRGTITGVLPLALWLTTLPGCTSDPVSAHSTVARISVTPDSATLRLVGDTARLLATAWTSTGDTVQNVTLTWAVSDSTVARISQTGLVAALGEGRATVTATEPGGVAGTAVARVRAPSDVDSVWVSPWGAWAGARGGTNARDAR